ncbi:hypothetical protein AA11825_2350 [Acetobacter pomorum DSM 11825]|nr:hypothetical protein [Acetobacter pomorum]GBR52844.1 hypothetical protein AA11825_2350 [Acetobacter pomorum DSM 11825]
MTLRSYICCFSVILLFSQTNVVNAKPTAKELMSSIKNDITKSISSVESICGSFDRPLVKDKDCKTTLDIQNTILGVCEAVQGSLNDEYQNLYDVKLNIGEISDYEYENLLNQLELEENTKISTIKNKIGDGLISVGCLSEAKNMYMNVIDTYTGSAYSAIRQHSQIKIDDIREMEKK